MCAPHVSLRGQRPWRSGPPEPELQARIRHALRRVPRACRASAPSPTSRRHRSASPSSLPARASLAVTCPQSAATPQLFAVSTPYVTGSGSFTIKGTGFGATKGTGSVTLDGTALPTTAWSNVTIDVTVPPGTPVGAHQLKITADNKQQTVNGLTFHVLGTGYNPTVREVGPGKAYATIQAALDAALTNNGDDLVVVFPGTPDLVSNPRGAYYENLIVASPVKLQGVGPGGFRGTTYVPGSSSTRAPTAATPRSRRTGSTRSVPSPGTAIQTVQRRRGHLRAGVAERHDASRSRAAVHQLASRRASTGSTSAARLKNGFPGNINDLTGGTDRAAPDDHHAGRCDLRERLCPRPPDDQQRRAEQRRQLRHHPDRHA